MWNNRVLEKIGEGDAAEGNLREKRAPVNIFHICSSLKWWFFCPHKSVTLEPISKKGTQLSPKGLFLWVLQSYVFTPHKPIKRHSLSLSPFSSWGNPHEQTTASSWPCCGSGAAVLPLVAWPAAARGAVGSLGLGSQVCPHKSVLKVSVKGQASALGNVRATHTLAKVMLNNILPRLVKILDS